MIQYAKTSFLVPEKGKRGTFLRVAFEHSDEWGKGELDWHGELNILEDLNDTNYFISEMFAQDTSLLRIISLWHVKHLRCVPKMHT